MLIQLIPNLVRHLTKECRNLWVEKKRCGQEDTSSFPSESQCKTDELLALGMLLGTFLRVTFATCELYLSLYFHSRDGQFVTLQRWVDYNSHHSSPVVTLARAVGN